MIFMRSSVGVKLRVFGLSLLILVIVLALAEFLLQFIHLSTLVASDPGAFIDPQRLRQAEIPRMISDPVLRFRPNPAYPEHDAWGYRNPEVPAPGEVDIVAIGDSQTYGAGVHRPEAWPAILQKEEGWRVYSLAFGGFGPAHYLILLKKGLSLKPRLIIAAFYSGNDLYDTFNLVYAKDYAESLFPTEDPALRSAMAKLQTRQAISEQTRLIQQDHTQILEFRPAPSPAGWLARSQLFQVWMEVNRWIQTRWAGRNFCRDPLDTAPPSQVPITGETQLTPRYRFIAVNQSDPRIREGFRLSREALSLMHQRTRAAGVRFLVLMIPTKERVYAPVMGTHRFEEPYASLVKNEEQVFAELDAFLSREGIPHLSLLPALRHALVFNFEPYRRTADGHPEPPGYRAIARCVSEFIHQEGLMDPPGDSLH